MSDANEIAALKQRIAVLEDIETLRRLKAQYARYCDPTHDIDGMVGLFSEDGVFDIGEEYGSYHGRNEIRAFLNQADGIIPWAIHYMIAPIIDVAPDGMAATGSWYLWQLATMPNPDRAGEIPIWIAGVYHDDFVKKDGRWMFQKVALRMQIMSPYEDGWVQTPWIGKEGDRQVSDDNGRR